MCHIGRNTRAHMMLVNSLETSKDFKQYVDKEHTLRARNRAEHGMNYKLIGDKFVKSC